MRDEQYMMQTTGFYLENAAMKDVTGPGMNLACHV